MPSRSLDPDTSLSVKIGATCSRNRYAPDHDRVIAELRELAGDRTDLLAKEVGTYIGFYGGDPNFRPLADALRGMTDLDLEPWIAVGWKRRHQDVHGTAGFGEPHTHIPPRP